MKEKRDISDETVISIENMNFHYTKGLPVLENVNLKIRKFETACIVGPNGGGKTTLLNLILGLLRPRSGKVRVFGMKPEDARIKIGYMPQHTQFDSSFPVSVMDVVLMGRINSTSFGRYTREAREAAMEAMKEMGMYDLRNRSFARLSGGQRQRVLIARALACAPQLLLLDEPTANVDPGIQEDFYGKIEELSERMSILIVSHDLGVVSKKIKSVICVNRRVHIHPTSELNGEIIQEIYGHGIDLVRHDYRCSGEGHVDE